MASAQFGWAVKIVVRVVQDSRLCVITVKKDHDGQFNPDHDDNVAALAFGRFQHREDRLPTGQAKQRLQGESEGSGDHPWHPDFNNDEAFRLVLEAKFSNGPIFRGFEAVDFSAHG